MRERSSTPTTAAFTFILIIGLSAPTRAVFAANDCIAKPNSPAPQGQHWYYRIDHTNNRQCWRLGPEGLRVQNSSSALETVAKPTLPPRTRQSATTGSAIADGQFATETNVTGSIAPVPWLGVQRFPELPPILQPFPQAAAAPETRIASALEAAPSSETASVSDGSAPPAARTEELQQSMTVRRASSPVPAFAGSEIDHTFAFLMIMFAVLAVAGPTLHYAERRRVREGHDHQSSRWAHVVALNAPTPRIRIPLPRDPASRPAPIPPIPPDRSERLAQALQQLVDRLQAPSSPEPSAATPVRQPDVKIRRSAR